MHALSGRQGPTTSVGQATTDVGAGALGSTAGGVRTVESPLVQAARGHCGAHRSAALGITTTHVAGPLRRTAVTFSTLRALDLAGVVYAVVVVIHTAKAARLLRDSTPT